MNTQNDGLKKGGLLVSMLDFRAVYKGPTLLTYLLGDHVPSISTLSRIGFHPTFPTTPTARPPHLIGGFPIKAVRLGVPTHPFWTKQEILLEKQSKKYVVQLKLKKTEMILIDICSLNHACMCIYFV